LQPGLAVAFVEDHDVHDPGVQRNAVTEQQQEDHGQDCRDQIRGRITDDLLALLAHEREKLREPLEHGPCPARIGIAHA